MNIARSVALASLAGATLAAAPLAAQNQWQWNGQLDAGSHIEIKGVNGGIRAVAASGNEVRVQATKSANRSNPDDVRFEVVTHPRGVTICAMYPSRRGTNECRPGEGGRMNVENNDVQVDWVVQVPRGVDFVGRTINGAIDAAATPAGATAITVNGDIHINTTGLARAHTINGELDIDMARADWNGMLRFETTNGRITITLPADLSAQVTATTVNGAIETDFPLEVRGRFGPKRLSGTVGAGGRTLTLTTVNGDIIIRRR